jgi:hypothetical protein
VLLHNGYIRPPVQIAILSTWRKPTRMWLCSWKL